MIKTETNKNYGLYNKHKMHAEVIFRIAIKNLFAKKLRTTLTALGVIIGVGSVVFLVSFGVGLQKLVEDQVVGSKSVKTIDVTVKQSKDIKLDNKSIKRLRGLPEIEKVGRVYTLASKVKSNNSELSAVVFASDQVYLELSSINLVAGQLLHADDKMMAIVNTSFLKSQATINNNEAIGQKININLTIPKTDTKDEHKINRDFTIVGVMDSGSGSEIFIPSYSVEAEGITIASQFKVLAKDREKANDIRKDIESLGFTTTSPLDTLSEIDKIFQLLQIILIGFGGIGMVIAILGMFNTLTISLLERTKEIALIITMGGQAKDIKLLFTIEALILSIIGGGTGVFAAYLIGLIGNLILNNYARGNGVTDKLSAFHISPLLVLFSLIATSILGLLVVYFPARRASKISPLDAMRE